MFTILQTNGITDDRDLSESYFLLLSIESEVKSFRTRLSRGHDARALSLH